MNSTHWIPVKLQMLRMSVYCVRVQIMISLRLRWIVLWIWRYVGGRSWSNAIGLDFFSLGHLHAPNFMYLHRMMIWWNKWNWFYQTTNNSFQPCCAFFVSETIIISPSCCSANENVIHLCPQLSVAQLMSLKINKQTMKVNAELLSCEILDIPCLLNYWIRQWRCSV